MLEGGAQGGRIVGDDAKIQALYAHAGQHGLDPVTVGVIDVAMGERGAQGFELVTCAEDGDLERAAHRHGGDAQGSQQRQLPGAEAQAARQHPGSLRHVLAAAADVLAKEGRRQKSDPVAALLRFFLHDDRLRARRHRGAGHDADAVTGRPFALIGLAGEGLARHGEWGAGGEIGQTHGVTVHGGVVEGGHRQGGAYLLGQYPIQRLGQRQLLRLAAAGELFQHPLQGLVQGEECTGIESHHHDLCGV
ncbi:hypothetical protein D3C79_697730 [compost metagenome]